MSTLTKNLSLADRVWTAAWDAALAAGCTSDQAYKTANAARDAFMAGR